MFEQILKPGALETGVDMFLVQRTGIHVYYYQKHEISHRHLYIESLTIKYNVGCFGTNNYV